eukprot:12720335-Alexandrium_andersonii.AAC.1
MVPPPMPSLWASHRDPHPPLGHRLDAHHQPGMQPLHHPEPGVGSAAPQCLGRGRPHVHTSGAGHCQDEAGPLPMVWVGGGEGARAHEGAATAAHPLRQPTGPSLQTPWVGVQWTRGHVLAEKRAAYTEAVSSLVRVIDLIKEHPRVLPTAAMQTSTDSVCLHLQALDRLGLEQKPKHHFLLEMAPRSLQGKLALSVPSGATHPFKSSPKGPSPWGLGWEKAHARIHTHRHHSTSSPGSTAMAVLAGQAAGQMNRRTWASKG